MNEPSQSDRVVKVRAGLTDAEFGYPHWRAAQFAGPVGYARYGVLMLFASAAERDAYFERETQPVAPLPELAAPERAETLPERPAEPFDTVDFSRAAEMIALPGPDNLYADGDYMPAFMVRVGELLQEAAALEARCRQAEAERDEARQQFSHLETCVKVGDRSRLAQVIGSLVKEKGATNYLQALTDVGNEEVVVLFQRREGKTPHELLGEALSRAEKAEAELQAIADVLAFRGPRAGLLLIDRVTEMVVQHKQWSGINVQQSEELSATYRRAEAAEASLARVREAISIERRKLCAVANHYEQERIRLADDRFNAPTIADYEARCEVARACVKGLDETVARAALTPAAPEPEPKR